MSNYSPYKPGEWRPLLEEPENVWRHEWKSADADTAALHDELSRLDDFFWQGMHTHIVCAVADGGLLPFISDQLMPYIMGSGGTAFDHVDRKLLARGLEGTAETHPRRWEITVHRGIYDSIIKVSFYRDCNSGSGIIFIDADANE